MSTEDVTAEIAAVLHRAFHDHWNPSKSLDLYLDSPLWQAQADALADLLAARDRRVRGEAVRSTADAWTQGAWSDVMLPKPTPPAVPVIAYSNRVGGWLRDRANEIEAE